MQSNARSFTPSRVTLFDHRSQADIFLVPFITKPKRNYLIEAACNAIDKVDVSAALKYLNERTAHKHLFVIAKEHPTAWSCKKWWSMPTGLLARAMRLSYSEIQPEEYRSDEYPFMTINGRTFFRDPCPLTLYPNLFSMPYLSTVHWTSTASASTTSAASTPPWAAGASRPILMLFLGGTGHGDLSVRRKLMQMCNNYRNKQHCYSTRYDLNRTLLLKREATFCLEPAGDSPYRRSFTDDIALGCIPVLFNRMQDHAYSWMWDGWREASRVMVPRGPFLKGQIDIFALLSSIPDHFLRRMQATIAANARKFQMSLEDDPGDAVHMILQGAMRSSNAIASELKFAAVS